MLLGAALAWFGGPWPYTRLLGVILVLIGILFLENFGPGDFESDG